MWGGRRKEKLQCLTESFATPPVARPDAFAVEHLQVALWWQRDLLLELLRNHLPGKSPGSDFTTQHAGAGYSWDDASSATPSSRPCLRHLSLPRQRTRRWGLRDSAAVKCLIWD